MEAYKLVRVLKDGSLAPLFINKKSRLRIGQWMEAEDHPTKGYSHRKGWHCSLTGNLPHLSKKGRILFKVEIEDYEFFERPENQGGKWVLAQKNKIY